jgi:hypothetical protein
MVDQTAAQLHAAFELAEHRLAGNEADRAAEGTRTIKRALRPAQHFDAF